MKKLLLATALAGLAGTAFAQDVVRLGTEGAYPPYNFINDAGEVAGFERELPEFEPYALPDYWKTDMLPEPLRHASGHGGSHTFITHEFVDALMHERTPAVNIYEALAMTVPGIVAHTSALQGGRQLRVPQFDPKE